MKRAVRVRTNQVSMVVTGDTEIFYVKSELDKVIYRDGCIQFDLNSIKILYTCYKY